MAAYKSAPTSPTGRRFPAPSASTVTRPLRVPSPTSIASSNRYRKLVWPQETAIRPFRVLPPHGARRAVELPLIADAFEDHLYRSIPALLVKAHHHFAVRNRFSVRDLVARHVFVILVVGHHRRNLLLRSALELFFPIYPLLGSEAGEERLEIPARHRPRG